MEIHHLVGLDDGGPKYDLNNLVAYCRSCHIDVHRKPVYEWQRRWQVLVDSL